MRRLILGAVALLLFVGIARVGALFLFGVSPGPTPRVSVVFDVTRGQNPREICERLEKLGVVSDADQIRLLGRLTGRWGQLKAGEYQLSSEMTPLQVLAVLVSGVSVGTPLTVREGENIFEIAEKLGRMRQGLDQEFLGFVLSEGPLTQEMAPGARRLEGYLFPETYSITRSMSGEAIARAMVRQFQSVWRPEWNARAQELGLSRHQVVTLASIIEKETGAPHERPLISSVFHNRLRRKMRLQSDPTTIYGMWSSYDGNIRRADLLRPTPYNTYTVPALPEGPIANPGDESMHAALYPAESDSLYFVSKNDGTHVFSSTLKDHNAAVRAYQLNARARQGKSWRDLSKTLNGRQD